MLFRSLVLLVGVVVGGLGQLAFAEGASTKISILHLNDLHGRLKEDEREGAIGFAKLKTRLDQVKEENPNTLLLSAGDTLHGTTLVNVTEGETIVKLIQCILRYIVCHN